MPAYLPPRAIQRLPLQMLRSQEVLREREDMAEAAESHGRGKVPPAWYVPGRMAHTRWKTPPSPVGWGESALSAYTALEQEHALLSEIRGANYRPPVMTPRQAAVALGADRLPTSMAADEIDLEPVSRGVVAPGRVPTAELSARIAADQREQLARTAGANLRRDRALAQAHAAAGSLTKILGR